MHVANHRLVADAGDPQIDFVGSPNVGGSLRPEILVLHYTAGSSGASSVEWFCDPAAQASAHLTIDRSGRVWQLVPFDRVAWHAGESVWDGRYGANKFSIGIELDNAGRLDRVGNVYRSWFKRDYPADEVFTGTHKFELVPSFWHDYTAAQIECCFAVAALLFRTYGLRDVAGHDDVAPDWLRPPDRRKRDPGPAFPLGALRARLLGRANDEPPQAEVLAEALNVRTGPGVANPLAAPPLAAGTRVRVLDPGTTGWARVQTLAAPPVEGWVASRYLRSA